MKKSKTTAIFLTALVLFTFFSFKIQNYSSGSENPVQDTILKYRDGVYEGKSRDSYTDEPYWGIVRVKVKKGLLTSISFIVRDSNLHETFNGSYEKHFEGNQLYIEQCRNDWKGVQTYPVKLLDAQDLRKVDVVSGATWSYNIFKASLEEAFKQSVK